MLTLLLKNRFHCWINSLRTGRSKKRRRRILGYFSLLLIPIIIFLNFLFTYRTVLAEMADGETWLYLIFSASMLGLFLMMVFSALAIVIHSLFLSKDLSLLLSSPLSIHTIFQYKLIEAIMANSTLFFFVGLPLIIALGMAFHLSWIFYFYAIFCCILFICIPIGVAATLTIVLINFMPAQLAKRLATIVFSFLSLLIWLGLQYLQPQRIQYHSGVYSATAAQMIQSKAAIYASFIPSQWFSNALFALIRSDMKMLLINTALLVTICLALYGLSAPLLQRTMSRDLFSGKMGHLRIKSAAIEKGARPTAQNAIRSPLLFSMWWKDIKILFRDSRFNMQIFLYLVIMILAPLIGSSRDGEVLDRWQPYMSHFYLLIFSALMASSWAARLLPAEGLSFSYLLCAPQRRRMFILSKLFVASSVTLFCGFLAQTISQFIRPAPMAIVVHVFLALLAVILASSGIGIVLGAYFAIYQWDHPKRMLSTGGNVSYMLITLLMLGIYILILIAGASIFSIQISLFFLIFLSLITIVLGTVLAEKRLDRQEWLY